MPRKRSSVESKPTEAVLLKPCETMSRNKATESFETTPSNKKSKTMSLKPCDTMSREKASESFETTPSNKKSKTMSLKPCDIMSREKASETLLIKPSSMKKKKKKKKKKQQRVIPGAKAVEAPVTRIKVGDHVDVKALLSTQARNFLLTTKGGQVVPISSLEGKYVIICCFAVPPDEHGPDPSFCRDVEALYAGLSSRGVADMVKLVIVPKFAPRLTDEPDFDTFFSDLSLSCLAIPFSDAESIDHVCGLFGDRISFYVRVSEKYVSCLVVHPGGQVLQYYGSSFLDEYGAQSFPFTEEHLHNLHLQDHELRQRFRSSDSPISLGELLNCDSLSQIGDGDKSILTSHLAEKTVGLYLCFNGFEEGGFMFDLQGIHQKCIDEGLEFEIILVPLPFGREYDPISFYNLVKQSALKDSTSKSWWTFPFNDEICRTLWRLFHQRSEDQLIILPHGGRLGDLWGRHIAAFYGIKAYPFTRDVVVEKKIKALRSVTLEQLLGDTSMPDVRNKDVLLYFDYPALSPWNLYLYTILNEYYPEIKAKYPDSVVVFVPFGPVSDTKARKICKKGWLILPPELIKIVVSHVFMGDEGHYARIYPTLATFGKDGKILSRSAQERLLALDSSASLFDDALGSEIIEEIKHEAQGTAVNC